MSNICPYKLCPQPKRKQHAFCLDHWKLLPLSLQREISAGWKVYTEADGPNLRLAAAKAWRGSMAKAHVVIEEKTVATQCKVVA
jgi:hypothetical protein